MEATTQKASLTRDILIKLIYRFLPLLFLLFFLLLTLQCRPLTR